MTQVEITYQASWRHPMWDSSLPSRQAWFVTCPDHPHIGRERNGERWGYSTHGIAQSVATRHLHSRYHGR